MQAISDAVADVGREVRHAMSAHPGFEDIGQRMLLAWSEGIQGLRDARVYAVGDWVAGDAFVGFTPSTNMVNAEGKNSASLKNNGDA